MPWPAVARSVDLERACAILVSGVRILCINPNREQMPWPVIPVGLCLVATALDAGGHEVSFLDLTFERDPARQVERAVRRHRPEMIALGIRNIDNCNFEDPVFFLPRIREEVVVPLRTCAPGAILVVGGAAVNVCPGEITDYLGAEGAPSPVLHFWSLGVEEQFYVFWPALLALVSGAAFALGDRARDHAQLELLAV